MKQAMKALFLAAALLTGTAIPAAHFGVVGRGPESAFALLFRRGRYAQYYR